MRSDFLEKFYNLMAPEFAAVKSFKVSNDDTADTLLPLLVVNVSETNFKKSGTRQYIQTLSIVLTIIIQETENPLRDLAIKEESIIKKILLDQGIKSTLSDFQIKRSSASNKIEAYQKFGAVSSELEIEVLFAATY